MQPVIKDQAAFVSALSDAVTLSAEEAALAHGLLAKLLSATRVGVSGASTQRELAPGQPGEEASDLDRALWVARSVYRSRVRRAEHFGTALFSEPAWDMLLVLFIQGEQGERMSVTRLAESSQSPLTTAIRWLDYLESQRMVVRSQCPNDRRKYFVSLSDKGLRMMTDYFCSLLDGGALEQL